MRQAQEEARSDILVSTDRAMTQEDRWRGRHAQAAQGYILGLARARGRIRLLGLLAGRVRDVIARHRRQPLAVEGDIAVDKVCGTCGGRCRVRSFTSSRRVSRRTRHGFYDGTAAA